MGFEFVLSGAIGGLLIGMTGVGGGSLMTPLLVSGFGIPPATAIGTDLIYAALTKAGAVVCHHRQRHVAWRTTAWLLAGSLPGSLLTLALLRHLTTLHSLDNWLRHGLSLSLVLTAMALWKKRSPSVHRASLPITTIQPWAPVLGFFIGVLVTLSSVGGGALGTALLLALYPSFSFARVVGTELAHAVPLTLIAGLGHWNLGHVDTALLLSLLAGSLPGLWLGTRLNRHLPENIARRGLTLLLLCLSFSLW